MKQLDDVKAVIFDLDGTLVDSMWMWETIDIEFLGKYGYSCPPELQKTIEGMGFTETAVYFKERFPCHCPSRRSSRSGQKCPLINTGMKCR